MLERCEATPNWVCSRRSVGHPPILLCTRLRQLLRVGHETRRRAAAQVLGHGVGHETDRSAEAQVCGHGVGHETRRRAAAEVRKVFYGQEPPSGESTTTEYGFNYQLFAVMY